MPDSRADTLRTLRGKTSFPAFIDLMVRHGLPEGRLNRQRLSKLEQGATAPMTLWEEIADALAAAGFPAEQVDRLREVDDLIESPPPSTSALRLRQWSRVVSRVPGNTWWQKTLALVATVTPVHKVAAYRQMFNQYGEVRDEMLAQVQRRLELGGSGGPFEPVSGDAVRVDRAASTLDVHLDHGDLFVLSARLHNSGTMPWCDRLLYRLGAPVASSLPLTPAVLPVPDTDPGGHCEVIIPGRAQWFPNLAVVSYVMVFPDLSSCLPGRIAVRVDTRTTEYDRSFQLPPGFKSPAGTESSGPV